MVVWLLGAGGGGISMERDSEEQRMRTGADQYGVGQLKSSACVLGPSRLDPLATG